ncbi:MAG: glycerol-3-phosphate 1-O-acyltransferase PlsB [Proteobacteria bacterium]|nr:glycerol-3-phosphate 1-O-acyltransferase PlsB [Pseudomonadota bacterium]
MSRLSGRLWLPWLRFTSLPQDAAERLSAAPAPVCYVLERQSRGDATVLRQACERAGLPLPMRTLSIEGAQATQPAVIALARPVGLLRQRMDRRPALQLLPLLRRIAADPGFDVTLVTAAVYWGRAPQRQGSWWRLALAEDSALVGRVHRLLTLLFNSRDTLVQFGPGQSLRALLGGEAAGNLAARRIAKLLQQQFSHARAAHIGPNLSHQRTLLTQVLRTRAVRSAVAQQAGDGKDARRRGLLQARELFEEIAANYSNAFVRLCEVVFTRLWTRVYDGVEFRHAQTLRDVAPGNEIIYVPCHRSHIDYLLLSYAIYKQGFAIPHIAAGINLNIPVVGRYLRKAGAFFIRRSFRGNALYAVVFMNYLAVIMSRGHPVEYFIEGGRSRTGRLLAPKTGMLSMTVRSFLRQPVRPVVFVPVYFGYERVMEVDSYVGELSGKPKQKESFMGLVRSLRRLRERFGRVHVNLGEPVHLNELLNQHQADWRQQPVDDQGRAPWVAPVVDELAGRIMRNINAAASVTPINLLALTLLATPRNVLREADLQGQLQLYLRLLQALPYSERVTVTELDAAGIIAYGEGMSAVVRSAAESSGAGELVGLEPAHAPAMTYYRNNVLHLFALPSLIACCFIANPRLRTEDIHRLAWRIYPYIGNELFLRWTEEQLAEVTIHTLQVLGGLGVLEGSVEQGWWQRPRADSAEAMQLSLLSQPTIQVIERYYLPLALLQQAGSGVLTASELQKRCERTAKQMVALYGYYAPEFFDRSLHEAFISLLRKRGVLSADAEGRLLFDEVVLRIVDDAQLVLSETLRHSILQVTHS